MEYLICTKIHFGKFYLYIILSSRFQSMFNFLKTDFGYKKAKWVLDKLYLSKSLSPVIQAMGRGIRN